MNPSQTPRTDALRKTYLGISNANPNPLLDHHQQLELETIQLQDQLTQANAAIVEMRKALLLAKDDLDSFGIKPSVDLVIIKALSNPIVQQAK